MAAPDQTGAPVFGFSTTNVAPGESARAVIVPPFPTALPLWDAVNAGDTLVLYEGAAARGHATVLWRTETTLPVSAVDEHRFVAWLAGGPEPHIRRSREPWQ